MKNRERIRQRVYGIFLAGVLGVGSISSCGSELSEQRMDSIEADRITIEIDKDENMPNVQENVQENMQENVQEELEASILWNTYHDESVIVEEESLENDAFSDLYMMERVVNVEEADLTHDGVMDKIVSRIYYPSSDEGKTASELINGRGRCYISVYDGDGLTEDWGNFDGKCIWEKAFSTIHPENGQLYLINDKGQDYLLWNTDYSIMGHGCYTYRVFYLTGEQEEIVRREDGHLASTLGKAFGEKEEIIEAEDSGHFSYTNRDSGNIEFPIDHLIEYTKELEKYMEESTLLIYCSTDEGRIRTFEEECSADVLELWGFLKSDRDKEELTMETLRETMERYYDEEWDLK